MAKNRDINVKNNSVAGMFSKKINIPCKAMGYTKVAADMKMRNMYALCDHLSLPDIFFTLTIDDGCSWHVRLIAMPGKNHVMPLLYCSEEACSEDCIMRRDARLKYPGTCALEYQSVVQVLLECSFGWNAKEQKGGKGIFGWLIICCLLQRAGPEDSSWALKSVGTL